MSGARANLAVTKDGGAYNKLQRPDNFLEESASINAGNGRKRERASVDRPTAGPAFGNKRAKTNRGDSAADDLTSFGDRYQQNSSVAPIAECGMRFTLPIDEEEAYYSDDSLGEALAYLRSVRSEASAIPNLLVTSTLRTERPKESIPHTSSIPSGQRAFYQDGAWISIDEQYEAAHDADYESNGPYSQELYHRQLVKRFETFRSTLNAYESVESIPGASPISSGQPPLNRHDWLYTIDREYPTMPQVCRLDERAVRRGLEYCARALDRFKTISKQKSCWIWTLLALSGDVGTLDSQKMGHIRDLGNKAAGLGSASCANSDYHNGELEPHYHCANDAGDRQDGRSGIDESLSCNASGEFHESTIGYVRSDAKDDLGMTLEEPPEKPVVPESQDGVQQPGLASELHKGANTDTNDGPLEEARARLLEQLGDNLVQAGIPEIDVTHTHHSEQLDDGSDPLEHEVKMRAMPSRAEAERQRQVLRLRESVPASKREPNASFAEPSTVIHSNVDDDGSTIVDLNTRVTIDMILTIVAECYGQRDLLKFRKPW